MLGVHSPNHIKEAATRLGSPVQPKEMSGAPTDSNEGAIALPPDVRDQSLQMTTSIHHRHE